MGDHVLFAPNGSTYRGSQEALQEYAEQNFDLTACEIFSVDDLDADELGDCIPIE